MPQKKESGVALVMALFILIVIMMLGMVFTMMMASETNTSVREKQSTAALYLADAGLQYAQYSLGNTTTWSSLDGKFSTMNLGNGSFSIHYYQITSYMAVSSWGYVYDSAQSYSVVREVAAQFSK
jgi:type II secretory pathway pseudopilin PulG